jgi:hypothetical protein
VDEHVEAEPLLDRDRLGDPLADERVVALLIERAGPQVAPRGADVGGLRERPDRGRGERGQRHPLALERAPLGRRRGAHVAVRPDRGHARPHRRVVGAG